MAKHCEQLEILKNVRPFLNMMHERFINVMDGKKMIDSQDPVYGLFTLCFKSNITP